MATPAVEATNAASVPPSSSSSSVEPVSSAPATTTPQRLDTSPSPDLTPIFDFLGERTWALQAIGYDQAIDRYAIYTKNGEGSPAVDHTQEPPTLRPPLDLVDDGGGRVTGEAHAIARNGVHSFDVYWTPHEVSEVQSLRFGVDALSGRVARRLHSIAGGRVVFEDITNSVEVDRGPLLRSHSVETTGRISQDWTVQFDAQILFALDVGSARTLVATAADAGSGVRSIDRLHLVEDDGFVRSMDAPAELLWIQLPSAGLDDHETCGNERLGLVSTGTNGVDWWDIDTTNQLLTACTGGSPISTTIWCCGMGELRGSMDSNNDGVEEIFVGGTSVGGGGGGMYSLVDGDLAPIETDGGDALHLLTGDVGNSLPYSFELPNTDDLRIHIQARPLTTESSCELLWPRPYSPLVVVGPDRTERLWETSDGDEITLHRIDPEDFIATEDGRFALLDYFPCSHEGTIKTIYTGRYEPSTGRLLEWQHIEPPDEYVSQRIYQRHPDRLVIDDDGLIIGELDTESGTLMLAHG